MTFAVGVPGLKIQVPQPAVNALEETMSAPIRVSDDMPTVSVYPDRREEMRFGYRVVPDGRSIRDVDPFRVRMAPSPAMEGP